MAKSIIIRATELLERGIGSLEELRIHEFLNDEEAHDDDAIAKLYADFSAEFDQVEGLLAKRYGNPSRIGKENDEVIPLNGIFRFSIWLVGNKQIFAAAAHEDRSSPIILMLGTSQGDVR